MALLVLVMSIFLLGIKSNLSMNLKLEDNYYRNCNCNFTTFYTKNLLFQTSESCQRSSITVSLFII